MRSRWKILTLCALGIYVLCIYYTLFINAEVSFWSQALKKKNAWVERMDAEPGRKIIFTGGSTTLFAFQSERLFQEQGIQSVNMGMTVGMGIPFLCSIAFESAQPGDTLILLLEPYLLCEGRLEPTALSVQVALRCGDLGSAFGRPVWNISNDWGLIIGSMRPGAYHSVTALLKVVFKRPSYRYPEGNVDASGYLFMDDADPELKAFGKMDELVLSDSGKEILCFFRERCNKKGVKLCYSLPVVFCESKHLDHNQNVHRKFLANVSKIIPVLEDGAVGCIDDPSFFYDRVHLSPKGATRRTDVIILMLEKMVMDNVYSYSITNSHSL